MTAEDTLFDGGVYSQKKDQAIAALLEEPTIKEAADSIGIGESTLHRWLQREDFQTDFRAARRRVVQGAINHLQKASADAVQTLVDIMGDSNANESTRVRAAKLVLDKALEAMEIEEIEARVRDLEKVLE